MKEDCERFYLEDGDVLINASNQEIIYHPGQPLGVDSFFDADFRVKYENKLLEVYYDTEEGSSRMGCLFTRLEYERKKGKAK